MVSCLSDFNRPCSFPALPFSQQLRVCSGHFHGGEKREGDIPVADPEVDPPLSVELPPPPPKRAEKRHAHATLNKRVRLDSAPLHLDLNSNGFSTSDSYAHSKGIDRKHVPGLTSSGGSGNNGGSSSVSRLTLKTPLPPSGQQQQTPANGGPLGSSLLPTKFSTSPTTSECR